VLRLNECGDIVEGVYGVAQVVEISFTGGG
jgi:hypothetical protein